VNDVKVAFKSGYDKYLRVDKDGTVTGRSDAVGPMEQWEPIFQVRLQGLPYVHSKYNVHMTDGRFVSAYRMLVAKPDRKGPPGYSWKSNIKTDLEQMGCEDFNWIYLVR
jgi:hypothetical protein